MGSAIPMTWDSNGPLISDEYELTFSSSGTLAVGNAVTLSAADTVSTTGTSTLFFFGVVSTSGQLAQAVNVIVRGYVFVLVNSSGCTYGHYAILSSTAGAVADAGAYSGLTNGALPRAVFLNSVTGAGYARAILF